LGLVSSGISGSIDQDGFHGSEIGLTGSIIIANVSDSIDFPRIPTDVGTDSIFYVSGSTSGPGQFHGKDYTGTAVFGGDLVVSGILYGGYDSESLGTFLEFQADQVVVSSIAGSENAEPAGDTLFFVSGTMDSKDSATKGTAVFGGDVVISGSFFTKQKHMITHKGTPGDAAQRYVRFNAAGSDTGPGVNNKFLAPYSGRLLEVTIRTTAAAASTAIAFHKASDGTANLSTSETEGVTVNIAAANTAYTVSFTETSVYTVGDILGISLNPTSDPGSFDMTSVWEFDTYL
jgi:hypothetical protein